MDRRIAKLFHVLVVGGAMSAGNIGCGGGPAPPDSKPDLQRATDAALGADAASAADAARQTDAADAAVSSEPCFCDQAPERCCDGAGVVKAGFECCWGTSC